MAGFSSALKLTDLDDFINPSQECVMPVKVDRLTNKDLGSATVRIHSDGTYQAVDELGQEHKLAKAKITLSDCLACSGCVTSAETVLLTQQSQAELLSVIEENAALIQAGETEKVKLVVVSLSPQSIASLAVEHKLNTEEAAGKLVTFFKDLGVDYVFDTTFARNFSLIESGREFVKRFKHSNDKTMPMLSSACPGWICYAEKVHGSYALPYISTTKSPQQVMGSLVKDYFAKAKKKRPDQIYHVTVMPCFDKKLEASRSDFYNELYKTKDVDCVLTTGEVNALLEEKQVNMAVMDSLPFDTLMTGSDSEDFYVHSGGGSGGYLEAVLKYSATKLFGVEIKDISYKTLRNKDFKEVTIKVGEETELRFAAAYGFRNIQNLVQKIKRGKCRYHFVEIMACPTGCLNGGGQIHASASDDLAKLVLSEVEQVYNGVKVKKAEDSVAVQDLYRDWLQGADSSKTQQSLHTDYHPIEKQTTSLAIKW